MIPALAPPSVLREHASLETLLERFADVDEKLLAQRALLRRFDLKFLIPLDALEPILCDVAGDFGALAAGETRLARYETLYYDTPTLQIYQAHHRGQKPRHKLRIRHYTDRAVTFLELKTKTPRGNTDKIRHARPFQNSALTQEEIRWALDYMHLPANELTPAAWTLFRRITLIGLHSEERATIDLDLDLRLVDGSGARRLAHAAIVEVKQPRFDPRSPLVRALRRRNVRPQSVSKYATAMALLAPGVKRNCLLPTLRRIGRLEKWPNC